jgi:predicted CXXCH cytochrome family protein
MLIAIFFFFSSFLCGCAPEKRYKVLSFFFDGVPNPAEMPKQVQRGPGGGAEPPVVKKTYRMHGPYAAKLCSGCHQRGTNILILPIEKLCLNCHIIQMNKKYIHGPVASGGCKICHEPHGSSFPFLLVSEPQKFCFYCHKEKDVARNEVHAGITEGCTDCHDAHMADNKNLLK